uniref:SET domain-containing protein n=1 Tax=Rhabditophanes sp. KR3021 TaxID=114890 RepID=A0AC35UAX9_9BILA
MCSQEAKEIGFVSPSLYKGVDKSAFLTDDKSSGDFANTSLHTAIFCLDTEEEEESSITLSWISEPKWVAEKGEAIGAYIKHTFDADVVSTEARNCAALRTRLCNGTNDYLDTLKDDQINSWVLPTVVQCIIILSQKNVSKMDLEKGPFSLSR